MHPEKHRQANYSSKSATRHVGCKSRNLYIALPYRISGRIYSSDQILGDAQSTLMRYGPNEWAEVLLPFGILRAWYFDRACCSSGIPRRRPPYIHTFECITFQKRTMVAIAYWGTIAVLLRVSGRNDHVRHQIRRRFRIVNPMLMGSNWELLYSTVVIRFSPRAQLPGNILLPYTLT